MTRYTVTWNRDAVDELGEIWLVAHDRNAVTDASAEIDRELATDPVDKGTPISEGLYAYNTPPLRGVYAVSEADRTVEVVRIRLL